MDDVARVYAGYDTGVRYADHHVGQVLDQLDALGLLEETAVMVSSDHGENLGELGSTATTRRLTSSPPACPWSWRGRDSPTRCCRSRTACIIRST